MLKIALCLGLALGAGGCLPYTWAMQSKDAAEQAKAAATRADLAADRAERAAAAAAGRRP